ncbi:putative head-tail connector protein [uncultured Mediterranean phage uvMED]|nr:putative head-tail connector protein [uncultured Mediterranean phage uvMED]BAR21469.1 putative head-tail connector protein [uncultured Mediterranean phage uvMED]
MGFFLYATIQINYLLIVAATVHATLKSENANSYVTLTEANSYFETVPDSTTWDNKTDDQKNRSLISATRWIDSFVFYGDRCDEDQALKFPRTNYQVDAVELDCSAIPNNIKYAQYELARALANDTDAMTGNVGTNGNIAEAKLGDLAVKYNVASQGTGSVNNIMDVYPWLQSYLGAYMIGGAGSFQMRVVRG